MDTCWDRALSILNEIKKSRLDDFGMEIEKPPKEPKPEEKKVEEKIPFDDTFNGKKADRAYEKDKHLLFFDHDPSDDPHYWYKVETDKDRTIIHVLNDLMSMLDSSNWDNVKDTALAHHTTGKTGDIVNEDVYRALMRLSGRDPNPRDIDRIRRRTGWRPLVDTRPRKKPFNRMSKKDIKSNNRRIPPPKR